MKGFKTPGDPGWLRISLHQTHRLLYNYIWPTCMLPKCASDVEMQRYSPWHIFPFPWTQQIRSWTFCLVLVWKGLMGHVMHLAGQTLRRWRRKGRPVLLQEHPSLPHRMRVVATTSWPMCLFWLPSCWVSFFMWLINGELSLCVGSSHVINDYSLRVAYMTLIFLTSSQLEIM